MAKRKNLARSNGHPPSGPSQPGFPREPSPTGRYLLLLREDAVPAAISALKTEAGLKVACSSDFEEHCLDEAAIGSADGVVLEKIGVAVVSGEAVQATTAARVGEEGSPILAIVPEEYKYALAKGAGAPAALPAQAPGGRLTDDMFAPAVPMPAPPPPQAMPLEAPDMLQISAEYLRGLRNGVNSAIDSILQPVRREQIVAEELVAAAYNESQATWGLQATRVVQSRFSGRGVKLCVLDTGFDLNHPDFKGRVIVNRSFVPNQAVQDGHGHGTHTAGTAAGPQRPVILPRYGVAFACDLHVGKVLSNQGFGQDGWILAGINWAIAAKCRIVSMSLGAPAQPGQPYPQLYENVARRALAAGTLIIAAAGNESNRPNQINPVGHPASCPSIMAVGAVDANGQIAFFSTRGQVDIAGPGVDVYSSVPMPKRYARFKGTSMATPHVSGIAALIAEQNPKASALEIWGILMQLAQRGPLPSYDAGAGLVQAP